MNKLNKKVSINYIQIPFKNLNDSNLSDFQKLLLGLITSLSRLKGYCFASNTRMGVILGKHKNTVSHHINILEKLGYIRCEIGDANYRKIYVNEKRSNTEGKNLNDNKDDYTQDQVEAMADNKDSSTRNQGDGIPDIREYNKYLNTIYNK